MKKRRKQRATLFLIEKCWEYLEPRNLGLIPARTRGVYALMKRRQTSNKEVFDVVYVGLAKSPNAGIKGRLQSHLRSKSKRDKWSHFSAFKVWDNIPQQFVSELEGILREIYRKDSRANSLNKQKTHKPLQKVRVVVKQPIPRRKTKSGK